MYNFKKPKTTSLSVNNSYEGETIEEKISRIVTNKEPITDGAPLIYTERKEGVKPEYDIRTDRFEIAVDAMDKVHKNTITKRAEKAKVVPIDEKGKTETKNDGGPESTQGTGGNK